MKISAAKREYFIEIEVRKFTPKTIRSYRNNLNLFLRFLRKKRELQRLRICPCPWCGNSPSA